jgi:Pro-kumamolisin, activation domain
LHQGKFGGEAELKKRTLVSWLSAVILVSLALPGHGSTRALAAPAAPKTLHGHTPDVVAGGRAQMLGHHPGNDPITLTIGLPLRDAAALDTFLHNLNDTSSPSYHQYLTQAQANQQFNPTSRQESEVVKWLQSYGLTVTQTYSNHLLVDAAGTFAQVERMLHTTLNDYRAKVHGQDATFYAPSVDPTVDASVADSVQSISGLDNVPRFHIATNGTAHNGTPYYPQDFANAYDVNPLWTAGDNGAGQHIGITLWTVPPSDSTLGRWPARPLPPLRTAGSRSFRSMVEPPVR